MDAQTQNIRVLVVHAKAVIHLTLYPLLQIDNHIDTFGFFNRAHTKDTAHIDNTNAKRSSIK